LFEDIIKKITAQSIFFQDFFEVGSMSLLTQLQDLVENIEKEEARSLLKTRHLALLANIKHKIDGLAFLFIMGPFVLNDSTSYNYYTGILCEIIRSIEVNQSSKPHCMISQNEDYEFFLDISCNLKKLCVDISMNEDIMKIS